MNNKQGTNMLHARYAFASLLLLSASIAVAQPNPTPPFKLPVSPVAPTPSPSAVTTLSEGQVFVIQRDADFRVYEGVKGIIAVKFKKLTKGQTHSIDGVFVDGNGVREEREYVGTDTGLFLAIITPKRDGPVDLILAPRLATEDWETRLPLTVKMGLGPIPPPKPDPTPDPKPVPIAATWIVVVEESAMRTPAIAAVVGDLAMWKRIEAKGVKFRVYDIDSPDAKAKKYDAVVAPVGVPAVILLDSAGKVLKVSKLPATVAELESLVTGGK